MSIHTYACIAASFLVLAAPAAAESEAVAACFNLPSNTQQRECLEALHRAASTKLDEVLLSAIARASKAEGTPSLAAAIRNSQNLWQAYRDAECRGVVGYDSRPSRPWVSACLAEKTLQRIRELEGS